VRERLCSKMDKVCRKFGIILNEELFDAYRLHNIVMCVCLCSAEDQCGPEITVLWVQESFFFRHWADHFTITKSLPIDNNTGTRKADVHTCPIGIRSNYSSVLLVEDSKCLDHEVAVIGHNVLG